MDEMALRVWTEIEPHITELGCELIEVLLGRSGRRCVLRVFVDKPGGVTVDDCAAVSQVLSPVLDATDLFSASYVLEVSSPGFDRPLRRPKDFERFVGQLVRVKSVAPVQGVRNFRGELKSYRDGWIVIDCDGSEYEIHLENIERANLVR